MHHPRALVVSAVVTVFASLASPAAAASEEQPLQGTVTYTAVEPDGAKTTWTLVTDGRQHAITLDGEKRWIGADGRFVQRKQFAEAEAAPTMTAAPSTMLPPRMIAGREANCISIVPAAMPNFEPRPDHLEACQWANSVSISFTAFGSMVDADIDAAFAKHGSTGVPASAALVGKQGVLSSWTATKLTAGVPSAKAVQKEAFLKFATAKDRCVMQLETGRALVKAAMVDEESHFGEFGGYTADLVAAGFKNTAPTLYTVRVAKITAKGYVIIADGIGEAKGDQWRIDERNQPTHVKKAACR